MFREALRRCVADKEWNELYTYGELPARRIGLGEDQVEDISHAHERWRLEAEGVA